MIVRPASLLRALRKGFRAAYDHLGYVVFVSFVATVITAALFSAAWFVINKIHAGPPGLFLFVIPIFAGYLCAVGVYYYVDKSVYNEHPALNETWKGIGKLFVPALSLFIIDSIITAVLLIDAVFFLRLGTFIGSMFGVLCAYLSLIWLFMVMYHLPLLAAQLKMESGTKSSVVIRKSFLLALGNPGFTVGLFLVIIAFAVLCAIPALFGIAVLFLGATAFLLTHALRELFIKYGVAEEEPEIPEDAGWQLPDTWRKRENNNDEDTGGMNDG